MLVLHPTVSFDEILDHVLLELGLPVASGGRDDLLARLAEFLRDHAHAGGNVAVFFDEAQALREETLASLPLLLDLVTDAGEPALQVILAGQPELTARLAAPAFEPIRRRAAVTARLGPLSPEGVRAYVRARLERAGATDPDLFEPEAVERVAALSGGVPRLINVLCESSLVAAFADGRPRVGAAQVEAAWADYAPLHRAEGTPMPAPSREPIPSAAPSEPAAPGAEPARPRRMALVATAVALLALLPLLATRLRREDTPVPVTPQSAPPETAPAPAAPPTEAAATPETTRPAPPPAPVAPEPTAATTPTFPPDVPVAATPRPAAPTALDAIAVVDRFWQAYETRDTDGLRALFAPDAMPAGAVLDVDPMGSGALVTPSGRIEAKPVGDRVTVRVPFQLNTRDGRGRAVRRQGVASLQVAMHDGTPRIVSLAADAAPVPRR